MVCADEMTMGFRIRSRRTKRIENLFSSIQYEWHRRNDGNINGQGCFLGGGISRRMWSYK